MLSKSELRTSSERKQSYSLRDKQTSIEQLCL